MENELILFFIFIVGPYLLILLGMLFFLIVVIKESRFYDKAYKAAFKKKGD